MREVTDIINEVDAVTLIKEVETYPTLWHVQYEGIRDSHKKLTTWMKVCQVCIPGFNDMTPKRKIELSNSMMKKWKNIKDSFLRTLRNARPGILGRNVLYARELHFITKSYFGTKIAAPGHECPGTSGDPTYLVEFLKNPDDDSPSLPPLVVESRPSQQLVILPDCLNTPPPNKIRLPKTGNRILRKRVLPRPVPNKSSHVEHSSFICNDHPVVSQNQSFFNSLLPIVDGFSHVEVVDFRLETLRTIKRMQNDRN